MPVMQRLSCHARQAASVKEPLNSAIFAPASVGRTAFGGLAPRIYGDFWLSEASSALCRDAGQTPAPEPHPAGVITRRALYRFTSANRLNRCCSFLNNPRYRAFVLSPVSAATESRGRARRRIFPSGQADLGTSDRESEAEGGHTAYAAAHHGLDRDLDRRGDGIDRRHSGQFQPALHRDLRPCSDGPIPSCRKPRDRKNRRRAAPGMAVAGLLSPAPTLKAAADGKFMIVV